MSKNVIETLQERGFIEAITSEELHQATQKPIRVYCGFDPTSDSLHLGNLVAIIGLAWFQRFGHTPVAIVGGGYRHDWGSFRKKCRTSVIGRANNSA